MRATKNILSVTTSLVKNWLTLVSYLWKPSTILSWPLKSFFVKWSSILASTKHSINVVLYCGSPNDGSHEFPIHSWFMSPNARVVRDVFGADGEVRDTISWMAILSFNLKKMISFLYKLFNYLTKTLKKNQLMMRFKKNICCSLQKDVLEANCKYSVSGATHINILCRIAPKRFIYLY